MIKLLKLCFLGIALLLLLASCGGGSSPDSPNPLPVEDTTPPKFEPKTDLVVLENQMLVTRLSASDDSAIIYSISGDDSDALVVDASSGEVRFKTKPNYASKSRYSFTATASDGTHSVSHDINVEVRVAFSIGLSNANKTAGIQKVFDYGPSIDISDFVLSHDDQIAYITFFNPPNWEYLKILDISNPLSPVELASYLTGFGQGITSAIALSADNKTLYVGSWGDYVGLRIIDVSNPASPITIGSYTSNKLGVSDIVLSNDEQTAYLSSGIGVTILDISNPKMPRLMAEVTRRFLLEGTEWYYSAVESLALSDDGTRLYTAEANAGIGVIDVSDPRAPKILDLYHPRLSSFHLSGNGTLAYGYLGFIDGWRIFNVSDYIAPTTITKFGPEISDIANSNDGNIFYINSSEGLRLFDYSEPSNPKLTATYPHATGVKADFLRLSSDETQAWLVNRTGLRNLEIHWIDFTEENRIEESVNFGTTTIDLSIDASSDIDVTMEVITDRDDIVTVGAYDVTLSHAEYDVATVSIPINSIADQSGLTAITVNLGYDSKVFSKTFYFNVDQ